MQRWVLVAATTAMVPFAAAAQSVSGDGIRQLVTGKTVHLDSPFGTIPITYNENGTMAAKSNALALTVYLGSATDRGRWSVSGDRLCLKFFKWFHGDMHCMTVRQDGRKIGWRRDDGLTGTATIAANEAAPPPVPSGLGIKPPTASDAAQSVIVEAPEPVAAALPMRALMLPLPRRIANDPEAQSAPQLIEAPTPVGPTSWSTTARAALERPQPVLAALNPASEAPMATRRPAVGPEPGLVAGPEMLRALAQSQAQDRMAHQWCRGSEPAAGSGLPALMALSQSGAGGTAAADNHSGHSGGACLTAEPQLMSVARLPLPRH